MAPPVPRASGILTMLIMFTGIIEEKGRIKTVNKGANSCSLSVGAKDILEGIRTGDSINTNGICLTVTSFDPNSFTVDVMPETLKRTSLGTLKPGSAVNLERALQLSSRLGGHIVSGHIDGTGIIAGIRIEENAVWYTIRAAGEILRYIVAKGSVAVDGISLTVADVSEGSFSVSVIPHTRRVTALSERKEGDTVNIECDLVGKYIEKFTRPAGTGTGIDREFLDKYGF
jgi:riboflavin synthase